MVYPGGSETNEKSHQVANRDAATADSLLFASRLSRICSRPTSRVTIGKSCCWMGEESLVNNSEDCEVANETPSLPVCDRMKLRRRIATGCSLLSVLLWAYQVPWLMTLSRGDGNGLADELSVFFSQVCIVVLGIPAIILAVIAILISRTIRDYQSRSMPLANRLAYIGFGLGVFVILATVFQDLRTHGVFLKYGLH